MSKESSFESVVDRLTRDQKRFIAELVGTFIVVVFATGSVVIDAKLGGVLGMPFIAFAPFVGVAIGVYLFGKISMAHFNPAVSVGFWITKHITKKLLVLYLIVVRPDIGDIIAYRHGLHFYCCKEVNPYRNQK